MDGLWFVSRTPEPLPPAIDKEFRDVARAAGFDVDKLQTMTHTLPPSTLAPPKKKGEL